LECPMKLDESGLPLWSRCVGAFAHLALKLCGVLPLSNFSNADSEGTPAEGDVEAPRRVCLRVAFSGSYRVLLLLTDVYFLCSTAIKLRSAFAPAISADLVVHQASESDGLVHPLVTDLVVAAAAVLSILACGLPYCVGADRSAGAGGVDNRTVLGRPGSQRALAVFLTWLLLVGSRLGADFWFHASPTSSHASHASHASTTSWDALHFGLFVGASARVAAAGLLVVSLAINGFERKSPRAVRAFSTARLEWNKFAATFRNTSESLHWCVVVLAGTAVFSMFSAVLDACVYSLGVVLPGIVLALEMLRVLLCVSATTDYCVKLPSLFTTVRTSSPQLEEDLLRLVQFLQSTEAGFYVSETRINTSGILKFAYFTAMAAAAFSTEFL
ncbi:unnamed protein product, partial [Polarella glacialis]